MSKVSVFQIEKGARIVGRGGVIYEIVDTKKSIGHDYELALKGPDGKIIEISLDMWTELTIATVLDEMVQ